MKTFLVIIGGLVALVILALLVVGMTLGRIVTHGINTHGPQYTQTKVQVDSVHLSPLSGSGSIENLVVGNPEGWTSDHAFSVGKIALSIQPSSLLGDHVVVNSLVVQSPDIVYETQYTTSNLQDLLKNIQKNDTEKTESAPAEKKPPKKIEIKSLQLDNAKITIIASGRTQTVTVPSISMENVGTSQGGLTPAQLSTAILKEVARTSLQAAAKGFFSGTGLDKLTSKATDTLNQLIGKGSKTSHQPATTPAP
ncbi:MAG TPA: AsmA family protein [Opitutaceae bacterium]